jgi:hypothetical protein
LELGTTRFLMLGKGKDVQQLTFWSSNSI